jgi:Uma2 family endonuclease
MTIQLDRHLFTLEEYERMVEAGGFDENARVELIRGEIVNMAPIGVRHAACVTRLTTLLVRQVGDTAVVWSQNPFGIPGHSRPQPDVALLRWRDDYYDARSPMAEDMLLVIEVADTSLTYDRGVKGSLYAEVGIPEYWIVNLQDQVIEVYTKPTEGAYKRSKQAKRGKALPLPGGLEGAIQVSDILGNA